MSFLKEKNQENGPLAEKGQDRENKRTRQKNKRGDTKGESNDSPEIPDRESGLPGLPARDLSRNAIANYAKFLKHRLMI